MLVFSKLICGYGGMADAVDSKSTGGDFVWVQVPLSAFTKAVTKTAAGLAYRELVDLVEDR